MITGDHIDTAVAIAVSWVLLMLKAITGAQLGKVSDERV